MTWHYFFTNKFKLALFLFPAETLPDNTLLAALDFQGVLTTVLVAQDLQAEALSFILRITGCLAVQCLSQLDARLTAELFQKATKDQWWCDASVRCAWLEALLKFAKAPGGWTWITQIGNL